LLQLHSHPGEIEAELAAPARPMVNNRSAAI